MRSCLYTGWVRHRRSRPRVHDFRYRMFMFYLDLDEVPQLDHALGLFSHNRFNITSFHERDHLDGRTADLRGRVLQFLRLDGVELPGGSIRLLTSCRIFGYVFNPISLYYCHASSGALAAVVAEVTSTFGERYLYRLTDPIRRDGELRHYRTQKVLHVSPFMSMDAIYDFHLSPIGDSLRVGIVEHEQGEHVLDAQLWGRRVPLTTRSLARVLITYPLLTLKTVGAIHLEALRLHLKAVPFHRQPAPTTAQQQQAAELAGLTEPDQRRQA